MSTKHTPGPWQIYPAGQGSMPRIITTKDGSSVADANAGFPCSEAEQDANACLIAAAPDLLAACKLAESELKHRVRRETCQGRDTVEGVFDALRAAIAKAGGAA